MFFYIFPKFIFITARKLLIEKCTTIVSWTFTIKTLSHTDNAGAIGLIEKYVSLVDGDDNIRIGYTEVKNDDTNVKGIIRRIIHALNSDKKTDNGIVYI